MINNKPVTEVNFMYRDNNSCIMDIKKLTSLIIPSSVTILDTNFCSFDASIITFPTTDIEWYSADYLDSNDFPSNVHIDAYPPAS